MNKDNNKQKQSWLRVISNIFWILKFVFKYAQTLIWDKAIRIPILVAAAYINVNVTRWILDSLENGGMSKTIMTIVIVFSFLILTNCIMAVLNIMVVPLKRVNLRTRIREDVIDKVSRIDQLKFQDPKFFDDYTLALNEVDTRAVQVLECMAGVITGLFSFRAITGATMSINRQFVWFGFADAVISLLLGMLKQNMSYKQTLETTSDDRKRGYVGRVTYQPEFTSDLKVYPRFKELLIHRYEQATLDIKKIILKYAKKIIWVDQGQQISGILLKHMLPWLFIARLLINGEVSIAETTVLSAAALTIPSNLAKFSSKFGELYTHSLYIERLRKLFSYESEIEKDDKDKPNLQVPVDITIKDVSFAYAKDLPAVLDHISFAIKHSEKIAIVGYNGAGKSTLVKLMVRLFDKTEGQLLVNGQPIDTYNVRSVRSKIAYLSQDYKVYGFTIAENILMHPVAGEKDVELVNSVLKMVGLYEKVLAFENGMDTFVTREFDSKGAYFSGGELQKLALARICAGNYDCIILDESTSALDPISEDEIINMIFTLFKDKTIVMISHRLATIQYVDYVYFMSQGAIKERGTHQQLMELNEEYAKFYRTQAEKFG